MPDVGRIRDNYGGFVGNWRFADNSRDIGLREAFDPGMNRAPNTAARPQSAAVHGATLAAPHPAHGS
jgi:hypothetical protein